MKRFHTAAVVLLTLVCATLLFWLVVHRTSSLWMDVALRPEVRHLLEQSLEDQKRLRALDKERSEEYRQRFETIRKLQNRLDVLRMSREEMLRRFEVTLVVLFALAALATALLSWMRYRRARDMERGQYLERVAVLQETARRQLHEIKGPLTAAGLELERLGDAVRGGAPVSEIEAAEASVSEELERLSRLARDYGTFAAIGSPVLRPVRIGDEVAQFCETFGKAWPGVVLRLRGPNSSVCADPDMLRQVLVNLCTNSARAIDGEGAIEFVINDRGGGVSVDVSDNGEGIADSLRARIFDPYVTTRRPGEGMGLGLAISRKIMLEHGGDLQLVTTSSAGTTFRLIFGDGPCS